jgi:DNA segregation ATPase FtsK/SpoIIIE, S-DNA-T family
MISRVMPELSYVMELPGILCVGWGSLRSTHPTTVAEWICSAARSGSPPWVGISVSHQRASSADAIGERVAAGGSGPMLSRWQGLSFVPGTDPPAVGQTPSIWDAPMLEKRDKRIDLLALGLLALGIYLAAALLSYDPADPPSSLVIPPRQQTANLCGRSGSVASSLLLAGLGVGAYYLLISLVILDVVLLARRAIHAPLFRLIGWLLSLVGFCTLATMALSRWSPGPVIGAGGYLGATGRGILEEYFAATGSYIVVASLIFGGLLLCTDYALVKILAWMVGLPMTSLGRGAVRVGQAYAGRARLRRSDLDTVGVKRSLVATSEEESDVRVVRRQADTGNAGNGASAAAGSKADPAAAAAAAPEKTSELRVSKPKKTKRDELLEQIEAANENGSSDYELPSLDLLLEGEPFSFEAQEQEVRRRAKILEKTFADFGFQIRVVEIQTGPVIAQFEVELEAGLRLSRITGLADDLAVALRVPSVRIVAPIPGKNTVGIEVPNTERQLVRLREVMTETDGKAAAMRIPIFLGKDVAGHSMTVDLSSLPHLLIAGRTGTGKSVCLNSIIISILMARRPDDVRMLLIDPKMVELSPYASIPHLMHPVVTDMRKAEAILGWAVEKMEERYQLLARAGVRHVSVYNQLGVEELMERMRPADEQERQQIPTHMPYIVIVADEMADLMMTAAKEVEGHIIRLAQKSRAVGIHLVLATQKPTVDVITGLIKSNLPARICFQVASRVDSRVVLDEMGADKLLGNGDMLFLWPGTSTLLRGQGTYLSDDEINRVIDAVSTTEPQYVKELVQLKASEPEPEGKQLPSRDDLYDAAVEMVIREGRGSCSLLQRALGIGYGRAARLIDYMAEDGVVGTYNGSQAREVLISLEQWETMRGKSPAEPAIAPPAPRKPSNRILISQPPPREDDSIEEEEDDPDEDVEFREVDGAEDGEASDETIPPWEDSDDEPPEEGGQNAVSKPSKGPSHSKSQRRRWKAESA